MSELEGYLSSSYLTNRQDISALDKAIEEAARTLCLTRSANGWPYELKFGDPIPRPSEMSVGTTAMVLTAIGRVLGTEVFGERGVPVRFSSGSVSKLCRSSFDDGLVSLNKHFINNPDESELLRSGTFGDNNPLTLSQVVSLITAPAIEDRVTSIVVAAVAAIDRLQGHLRYGDRAIFLADGSKDYRFNAFIPLRAIRTARMLDLAGKSPLGDDAAKFRAFFETTLHEQLSFSSIPDSRFDPAELVFSLEGLLICAEHAVDRAVLDRVIEVLADKQSTSSHWRPSKPFLTSKSGGIALPLSVEVANSLMRSIEKMDEGRAHDTYTSKALPLLRRFWGWVQARTVRGAIAGVTCSGWHSEHINVPDIIHTWDTSQVVEFMAAYRDFLEREIAKSTLHLSGLVIKEPEARRKTDKPAAGGAGEASQAGGDADAPAVEDVIATAAERECTPSEQWDIITKIFEASPSSLGEAGPVCGDETVYRKIGKQFVEGWHRGSSNSYSMLLYGPPGTGKTSIATGLSQALQMPLITVTVSDFLGGGGVNVEARAKAIFQTLMHQRDVIILFDEIDSFLLHRDSKIYREQDTLFQFLTPGMLPKLQQLRDAKASIFIVATNYENRIDPAIKRAGRIDHKYLVQLPNSVKRKHILIGLGIEETEITPDVIRASLFLGYGDLKTAANEYLAQKDAGYVGTARSLLEVIETIQPASSLRSYLNRIVSNPEDRAPAEIDGMIRLADEVGASDKLQEAAKDLERLGEETKNILLVELQEDLEGRLKEDELGVVSKYNGEQR